MDHTSSVPASEVSSSPRGGEPVETLTLLPEVYRQLIEHAREGWPEEVCGVIGGRDGVGTHLWRTRNAAESPRVEYLMDPEEQVRAFRALEEKGLELIALYHSHPHGPETPSARDRQLAYYPEAVYLICSLADPERPRLRGFRIQGPGEEARVTEVELHLQVLPADLPRLEILPTDVLFPHEDQDPGRSERLARRLRADGVLRDPPIVAPLGDGRYVVLDGANRTTTLKLLGIPHALVQVVAYDDPDQVELGTWYHLIAGIDRETLLQGATRLFGQLRRLPAPEARAALETGQLAAYLRTDGGEFVWGLPAPEGGLIPFARAVRAFVNLYRGKGTIHRVLHEDWEALRQGYGEAAGLAVFRPHTPAEVQELVRRGELVASGITRHVIRGRALRVNCPLSLLEADLPLLEKNLRLAKDLRARLQAHGVRYYPEPTYLFDS